MRTCASRCLSTSREVTSRPISRTRSLLQGEPAAPTLFNITLETVANKFQKRAEERIGAFLMKESDCVLILFADNYGLISNFADKLNDVHQQWITLLMEHGWKVPPGRSLLGFYGPR